MKLSKTTYDINRFHQIHRNQIKKKANKINKATSRVDKNQVIKQQKLTN